MTIFNVSPHLKKGGKDNQQKEKDTRGRDFEAENLIVIAKRAQQERENDFRDLFLFLARFCAISLPASFVCLSF